MFRVPEMSSTFGRGGQSVAFRSRRSDCARQNARRAILQGRQRRQKGLFTILNFVWSHETYLLFACQSRRCQSYCTVTQLSPVRVLFTRLSPYLICRTTRRAVPSTWWQTIKLASPLTPATRALRPTARTSPVSSMRPSSTSTLMTPRPLCMFVK